MRINLQLHAGCYFLAAKGLPLAARAELVCMFWLCHGSHAIASAAHQWSISTCIAEQELLEDSMFAAGPTPAPIFETFWQGRLIPGARIDTLPFIEVCQSCARHLSCICL